MLTIKYPGKNFGDTVLLIAPLSVEFWTLELTQEITAKSWLYEGADKLLIGNSPPPPVGNLLKARMEDSSYPQDGCGVSTSCLSVNAHSPAGLWGERHDWALRRALTACNFCTGSRGPWERAVCPWNPGSPTLHFWSPHVSKQEEGRRQESVWRFCLEVIRQLCHSFSYNNEGDGKREEMEDILSS